MEEDLNEHTKLKEEVKELSETLEEKYDEKIKSLETEEIPVNHKIERLQEKYDDLSAKISENRRAGKDMFIAHNIILRFPSLLQMAKATNEEQDFMKAERVLDKAKKEMEDAIEKKSINIRKEIELQLEKEKLEETSNKGEA